MNQRYGNNYMNQSHVFDPKNIDILEMEERKTWQNPEEILGAVEIRSDFVVADLGCGSGFFTVPLSQKVKKVYGIDVQKEMLDFLEQKIQKLKIKNIELLLSKKNEIPLENESVDLLVSMNTLHEFDDKKIMIEKMRKVLKRGGKALIVDFKKENTGFWAAGCYTDFEKASNKSLREKRFHHFEVTRPNVSLSVSFF